MDRFLLSSGLSGSTLWIIIALCIAVAVAAVIAIVCILVKNKKSAAKAPAEQKADKDLPAAPTDKPAAEEPAEEVEDTEAEDDTEEDTEDEDDGEVSGLSGISLKESFELAAMYAQIKIGKASVADWLSKNYGDELILNRRANRTKTGLPLADTHYVVMGAKKKCFAYVYELAEDKAMLLLKTDDQTAKQIAEKYPMFVKSRFPKSRREQWYTLVPDSGFSSSDEVFDVIALVLSKYTDKTQALSAAVREELAHIDEIKRSNITAEEVKNLVSDEAANALVTGKMRRRSGKKFAVNVDTLSQNYQAEDTVDIVSLKQKKLIPNNAQRVKILARGTLDKPLTVIADDFSADAIKMIVLTDGKAVWS